MTVGTARRNCLKQARKDIPRGVDMLVRFHTTDTRRPRRNCERQLEIQALGISAKHPLEKGFA